MRAGAPSIISSRLFIVAWVILWMATVPLFHTHLPDVDGPRSLQGGLAHTVFSPDLPGEFSRFSQVIQRDHVAQLSNPVSNSPELDFVLSLEDSKKKMGEPAVVGVFGCLPHGLFFPDSPLESRRTHGKLPLCAAPHGPRAPPSVVSS